MGAAPVSAKSRPRCVTATSEWHRCVAVPRQSMPASRMAPRQGLTRSFGFAGPSEHPRHRRRRPPAHRRRPALGLRSRSGHRGGGNGGHGRRGTATDRGSRPRHCPAGSAASRWVRHRASRRVPEGPDGPGVHRALHLSHHSIRQRRHRPRGVRISSEDVAYRADRGGHPGRHRWQVGLFGRPAPSQLASRLDAPDRSRAGHHRGSHGRPSRTTNSAPG